MDTLSLISLFLAGFSVGCATATVVSLIKIMKVYRRVVEREAIMEKVRKEAWKVR